MQHRPQDIIIEDEKHYYPLNLIGHVHDKYRTQEVKNKKGKISLIINTSLDTNNYYPYSFNEIMGIYYGWLNNHPKKKEILSWILESKRK